ncbi:MAG: pantoate--beta-alanine ligase [Micrococcales bacterium]|nr:pantoate--beta-alanine ligase [Micrococcales bacterium]
MSQLPVVLATRAELEAWHRSHSERRAVVMTMGALHEGHLALVDAALRVASTVIVSIFVNPLQFGPGEDFDAYPRTLDADVRALAGRGVAAVFAPSAAQMYPGGRPSVRVVPGPVGEVFEGAIRPDHFSGVLTVVLKLLALTRPDVALFGQKDAQQLALIRQMARDLNLPVSVVATPIVRDDDGLATSSRNRFLSASQRQAALALPQAIDSGAAAAAQGAGVDEVRRIAGERLARAGDEVSVDYLDVVDSQTFTPLAEGVADSSQALLIGAIRVGGVRLIDNAVLER